MLNQEYVEIKVKPCFPKSHDTETFFFSHSEGPRYYNVFKIQPLFISILIVFLGSVVQNRDTQVWLSMEIITEMYSSVRICVYTHTYNYIIYTYNYVTIHRNYIYVCNTGFI